MRTIIAIIALFEILLTCLVGACAALAGWSRIDGWCERHFTDTDGQPETPHSALRAPHAK
jgi:hypothetical protein